MTPTAPPASVWLEDKVKATPTLSLPTLHIQGERDGVDPASASKAVPGKFTRPSPWSSCPASAIFRSANGPTVSRANELPVGEYFVCVQSIVPDGHGTLWVLDPGAPGNEKAIEGAAKLVGIDLATNHVTKVIPVASRATARRATSQTRGRAARSSSSTWKRARACARSTAMARPRSTRP